MADQLLRASLTRDTALPRISSSLSPGPSSNGNSTGSTNLASPASPRSSSVQAQSRLNAGIDAKAGSKVSSITSSSSRKGSADSDSFSGYIAAEAKLRIQQVKLESDQANANSAPRATKGFFKSICSIDMLFLIDTTGSMRNDIQSAREQVRSILNDIGKAFLNESVIRVAVVGYKDHEDTPNIQFLDFTLSIAEVSRFLDTLVATGGERDEPEDVLGGGQSPLP